MQYDLHSHSTASDGSLAPADLVRHAAAQGVHVLALTDHDVTDGLVEAAAAAAEQGIGFVTGVEISTLWQGRLIHIVGLGFDPANTALQQGLAGLREQRQWRAGQMAARLERLGIVDALEGANAYANGQIVSRTHFARHLQAVGQVRTMEEAFKRYLGEGKPAFVGCDWVGLADCVGWITAAGGQAVIAHPGRYQMTLTKLRLMATEFRDVGGIGLEVISGSQRPEDVSTMAELARRLGLRASVGSDYHGPGQAWLQMGRLPPLPKGCEPLWGDWTVALPLQGRP